MATSPQPTTESRFKEWLDQLELQSWQLEMVISGALLALLIQLKEPGKRLILLANEHWPIALDGFDYRVLLYMAVFGFTFAWIYAMMNTSLHLFFRFMWVGAIGLRYLSREVDFEELNYSERFTRYLRRRTPSFDQFIQRLENICSVIFAFTFVLIFSIFSGLLLLVLFTTFNFFMLGPWMPGVLRQFVFFPLSVVLGFTLILYLLDFLLLGNLKRWRWKLFSRFYLFFYRIYTTVSLAFVYRPLLNNLLDNRFGRRVARLTIPYLIFPLLFTGSMRGHAFFPEGSEGASGSELKAVFCDDLREHDKPVELVSLPGKYVRGGYLEVFLLYSPGDDAILANLAGDTAPLARTGLRLEALDQFSGGLLKLEMEEDPVLQPDDDPFPLSSDSREEAALELVASLYLVGINDSLYTGIDWQFYRHPQFRQKGLLGVLDVADLPRGRHELKVRRRTNTADPAFWSPTRVVPFWKE